MGNVFDFYQFINEGKNIGLLYHFTSLSDAISIIEMDRLYSTQNVWSMNRKEGSYSRNKKYSGQISFTRDKLLYQDKPKGVSFGVRFVFDGNKLSNDFKIKPVKFSNLWNESEEGIFTIGSWSDRDKLKRHQIFNINKYIVSIDLMPFDIYQNRIESYEIENYEKIGMCEDTDVGYNGKPKRGLVNKAKIWFEDKGLNVRLVHEKLNKKSYISDKNIKSRLA
jgi:hypothetical protein